MKPSPHFYAMSSATTGWLIVSVLEEKLFFKAAALLISIVWLISCFYSPRE
jgi:hypothetical protein